MNTSKRLHDFEEEVIYNYKHGGSLAKISEEYRIYKPYLREFLAFQGIRIRSSVEQRLISLARKKGLPFRHLILA